MKVMHIPFLVVLVSVVLLIIFFGAWAVTSDQNRLLSFGIAGAGASFDAGAYNPSQITRQGDTGAPGKSQSKADTWWGTALIRACPLH